MAYDLFDTIIDPEFDVDGNLVSPGNITSRMLYVAMVDYAAGQTTRNQIVAAMSLTAEQTADLDALLAQVDAMPNIVAKMAFLLQFEAVMEIAMLGYKYTDKLSFKTRLGI